MGDVRFRGINGYFALTSDIPDVSNLCRFNFINSISKCKSDRINFLFRCTDSIINLDPFDAYPDGTILLITVDTGDTGESIYIKHQSGRWYSRGISVDTYEYYPTYNNEVHLITKNNGTVHHYKFN